MLPAPAGVFVAINEQDGSIVGASFVKPNQPGLGAHVANAAFMVAPNAAGHGVGRALAEHAIEWARQANFAAMQFNFVVSTNLRAIALWKHLGFSIVGTIPQAASIRGLAGKVDAFVMHRFSLRVFGEFNPAALRDGVANMILRHRKAAEPIIRFAIWFLLVAVCYRNTQSAFFRAESGWYQFISHSNPRFPIHLLASRYQGHYTPLAFIGEFELSRLVGPHEFFWKWRQIMLLSVLATAISMFTSRLAHSGRISIVPAEALAWAITALYVCFKFE